jgi:hypothetical protein
VLLEFVAATRSILNINVVSSVGSLMRHRNSICKQVALVTILGLLVLALFGMRARAAKPAQPVSTAPLPGARYHVVHGWPVLPENEILDEVSSVGVDSRGDVFVLQRGGRKWPDSDVLDQTPSVPRLFSFSTDTPGVFLGNGEKNCLHCHIL